MCVSTDLYVPSVVVVEDITGSVVDGGVVGTSVGSLCTVGVYVRACVDVCVCV